MPIEKKDVWFKIAANPKGIKEKLPQHWRCFVLPGNELYILRAVKIFGPTNESNFISRSTDEDDVDPRAWFEVYGDILIGEDEIGIFTVKNPS